jgi:hypothetical protein
MSRMRALKTIALIITATTFTTMTDLALAQETYRADLTPLNANKIGSSPHGVATLEIRGNVLKVHIKMEGVPANIEHWEHFHGFPNGTQATCATEAQDSNGDGYIDLDETESVSGTTMVPFNAQPERMDIPSHSYPHASAAGDYEYTKLIPLAKLRRNFAKAFGGSTLDLEKRVIYVHGVPDENPLPQSVGSLGTIPSHITLPIACGQIVRIK